MARSIFRNYKRITGILWKISKGSVILIILLTVLLGVIPNISTVVMRYMMNLLELKDVTFGIIWRVILIYISIDFLLSLAGNLSRYVSGIYEQKLVMNVELMILHKTGTLGLKDFENSEIYDIMQRAQSQGGSQIYTYFSHITAIIQYMTMAVGAGLILLSWNSRVIILVLVIAIIHSLIMTKINELQFQIMRSRTSDAREKWYYQFVLTNDIAFKEVKTYHLHSFFVNKFWNISKKFFEQDKDISKKILGAANLRVLFEQAADLYILGRIFYDTYLKKILLGDMVAYIRCISTIKSNISALSVEIVNVYRETLFVSQLFEFLDMDTSEKNDGKIIIDKIEEIVLKNVSYRYPNAEDYAVKNMNLKIKNENFVLVGRNGSGKSTLVKLLAGFYEDYEGEIFINGIELRKIDKDCLRTKIGLLFQDFNKYEMTVRENVAAGNLCDISNDNKIRGALRKADSPERLSDYLDRQLGGWFRNGHPLSGGEWLRIGISRVFLRKAELYILDEPNAALDPIGEETIFKSLIQLVKGKMSVIITHRIGSIEILGGTILVMEKGEIIGKGNHAELLDQCALYRELYMKCVQ